MRIKKVDDFLFRILLCLVAGVIGATVLGLGGLSSVCFALTFPATAALWLYSVRRGLRSLDWLILGTAVLAFVCVLVNLLASGGGFSLSYFKKPIMFTRTLMLLSACYGMRSGVGMRRFAHGLADILVLVLLAAHLLMRDQMHTLNDVSTRYAAFRFSNPNLTAIFFTCLYMLELIRMIQARSRQDRIIHAALTAVMGFFVLDTRSRNGLLVGVLFTALAVCVCFRKLIWQKLRLRVPLRITLPAAGIISVIPAAFAALYMALIGAPWVQTVFGFLVSEGKQLDSRVKMWSPAIEAIGNAPLTGDFYTITAGTGSGQMHNTHLDIAASYGIIVLVLVCVLLTVLIYQNGKRYRRRSDYLYMLAFCCTLMLGIFESVMFSGGLGTYIYMCMFLLLSKAPKQKGQERS